MIESAKPELVLLPHTYQVRDFAPKLAASLGKGMIGDCIGLSLRKRQADLRPPDVSGPHRGGRWFSPASSPWIASFQAGAFRADLAAKHASGKAPVKSVAVELKPEQIRTKPLELFREAKQAVDLTQAPILVSVGRGIKAPENIALAEKLAKLMGGEVSASRPICDEGWLPMDRQIGSSGQTVAPKLYLALGISGAIQHVVGMKARARSPPSIRTRTRPSSRSPITASSATSSRSSPPSSSNWKSASSGQPDWPGDASPRRAGTPRLIHS